jgi:hypothetical protein
VVAKHPARKVGSLFGGKRTERNPSHVGRRGPDAEAEDPLHHYGCLGVLTEAAEIEEGGWLGRAHKLLEKCGAVLVRPLQVIHEDHQGSLVAKLGKDVL